MQKRKSPDSNSSIQFIVVESSLLCLPILLSSHYRGSITPFRSRISQICKCDSVHYCIH